MSRQRPAIRTYKYLLKPSAEQIERMEIMLRVGCDLYNHALKHRRRRWARSRCQVTYVEQARLLTQWRAEQPADNPLQVLGAVAGQQVLRRLDRAYKAFLKGKHGTPRFKRYRAFNSLNWPAGFGAALSGETVRVTGAGHIPLRLYRPLPEGTLKNIIIKRSAGRWWVYFQIDRHLEEAEPSVNPPVGIDVGLHHALALSDGTLIDSPRYLQQSLMKLRVLQRRVARRKKGSRRRYKAVQQLAKQHERIANQRRAWWHQVTRVLVDQYGVIVLEGLNLTFMLRNGNLSQATHDVSIGMFRELLNYKAVEAGVEVIMVDPAYTSQRCSQCGRMEPKPLRERVHRCQHCHFTLDRDVNAARNILSRSGEDRQALTWSVGTSVA